MAEEILQQIRAEMERAYRPPETHQPVKSAQDDAPAFVLAPLRSALSALYASYATVGQLPPEPPTFRGHLGTRLVKLVRRMLFWYTPQIVHFQYSVLRALEEQAKVLECSENRVRQLESELAEQRGQNEMLHRALDDLKITMAATAPKSRDGNVQW